MSSSESFCWSCCKSISESFSNLFSISSKSWFWYSSELSCSSNSSSSSKFCSKLFSSFWIELLLSSNSSKSWFSSSFEFSWLNSSDSSSKFLLDFSSST
ncbi:MAG: hypothetical protein K2H11_01815 [Malacoplasma sp.]|nr:hypothetical protein [Malacoplasma sp.]